MTTSENKQAEPVALEKLFAELLKGTYSGKESYYNDEQISDACYAKAFEIALVAKKKGLELYTHPAPAVAQDEQLREHLREAITSALGEAYDCTRVWEAWHYGTMGPGDFIQVAGDAERVEEIVEAVVSAIAQAEKAPAVAQPPVCQTCNGNGRIGGPSYYAPDEGGVPCPDCNHPPAEVVRELVKALRQCHKTLVDVRFFVDERVIEKVVNAEIRAARALIKAKEHGL